MIVRGPFNIKWGANTLEDIEAVEFQQEIETEDYTPNSGHTFEIDKSQKVTVVLTLLSTDIASLAAIFPQYFVPQGGTLSSGDTVEDTAGAIDFDLLGCDDVITYNDLDITSCGDPGQVIRVRNTRTKLDNIQIAKITKVNVKFISEISGNEAAIQIFNNGTLNTGGLLTEDGRIILTEGGDILSA